MVLSFFSLVALLLRFYTELEFIIQWESLSVCVGGGAPAGGVGGLILQTRPTHSTGKTQKRRACYNDLDSILPDIKVDKNLDILLVKKFLYSYMYCIVPPRPASSRKSLNYITQLSFIRLKITNHGSKHA